MVLENWESILTRKHYRKPQGTVAGAGNQEPRAHIFNHKHKAEWVGRRV